MSSSGLYGSDLSGGNTRRAATAELIGTFLLVFTGTAVAVSAATGRTIAGQPSNSLAVALAFGLVLVALVSALGHVSGAHLNPAVTVALALTRKFPWRTVPAYVVAQLVGAVLASLVAVTTRLVLFDTAVVDLSEHLADPVDVLFGTQLGGGTDIDRALAYCQGLITRPSRTILVLVTDLYEGGNAPRMLQRAATLVHSGVTVICLLALSDQGTPAHDSQHAAQFAALGIPTFACTPGHFPELMAAAIGRQDLRAWAARQDIPLVRPG